MYCTKAWLPQCDDEALAARRECVLGNLKNPEVARGAAMRDDLASKDKDAKMKNAFLKKQFPMLSTGQLRNSFSEPLQLLSTRHRRRAGR